MDELAFPQAAHGATGMTLRDYFAAKAMQAVLSISADGWPDPVKFGDVALIPYTAAIAYKVADAMMKARHGH